MSQTALRETASCLICSAALDIHGSHPLWERQAAFISSQTSDPVIAREGTTYLSIVMVLSIGMASQVTMERLLQSTGRTFYTMITQALGAIINIIMDPIMIFGLFGFPRLGVAGAAYATIIGQSIAASLALFFNLRKNADIRFSWSILRLKADTVKRIYYVGVPSILMIAIGSVMTYLFNLILISIFKHCSGGIRRLFQASELFLHACFRYE